LRNHPAQSLADEPPIQQASLNLLSNAIKFTPAGGQVVVTAEVEPDRIGGSDQ
jgi:signal transduction histidine kinase